MKNHGIWTQLILHSHIVCSRCLSLDGFELVQTWYFFRPECLNSFVVIFLLQIGNFGVKIFDLFLELADINIRLEFDTFTLLLDAFKFVFMSFILEGDFSIFWGIWDFDLLFKGFHLVRETLLNNH